LWCSRIHEICKRLWQVFIVPTQTESQRQALRGTPAVFSEDADVVGCELEPERAKGLVVTRVARNVGDHRRGRSSLIYGRSTTIRLIGVGGVFWDVAVAERAVLEAEIFRQIMRVAEVHAELHRVTAGCIGYRIGELRRRLVRIRGAFQKRRR